MQKLELFHLLLDQLNNATTVSEEYKYIGTGNPDARILIVGKEVSIQAEPNKQNVMEICNNFSDWKAITSCETPKVENWNGSNYSPLYPYKGQLLKIDNGKNRGTSRTWYNYQKLYNLIVGKVDNQNIDFHEGVFITEANSSSSPKTKDADTASIQFRKESILKSEFFQSFPVVILSGLGYFEIKDSSNEIEEIFGVKFVRKELASNQESQAYWIHEGTKKPKLLINTRQLSIGVSDLLLEAMASEINKYRLI